MSEGTLVFSVGWSKEDQFAWKNYFTPARQERLNSKRRPLLGPACIRSIAEGWPAAPDGLLSKAGARAIIAAVENFGVAAIHFNDAYLELPGLTVSLPYDEHPFWRSLNMLVSAAVGSWQHEVKLGRPDPSLSYLKEIGKALVPPAKGKGKKGRAIVKSEVGLWYYKMLFRVTYTAKFLKERHKLIRADKVSRASELFGLSIFDIKRFWNLDDENSPIARPLPLKEMARILTAEKFGITQHRVSNIIVS